MATRTLETIIAENVARVRENVASACIRAGRDPGDVTLIGVTKSAGRPAVDALLAAGVRDLGENRVQDALAKFGLRPADGLPPLPPDVRLHMIGNLQTNKARDVARAFSVVHSLNRFELADALDRVAGDASPISVLLEVNLSGEMSKQGIPSEETREFLGYVLTHCSVLSLDGLMTIGPNTDDAAAVRAAFRRLRELRDELRREFPALPLPVLSMGMSNDYPLAVEEGATHIRVGRALFTGIERPLV